MIVRNILKTLKILIDTFNGVPYINIPLSGGLLQNVKEVFILIGETSRELCSSSSRHSV